MTTVYIISAPSGSGKSTLVEKVREIVSGLDFSVSYTTRPPRGNEQDGLEYYFVPRSDFDEMVHKDEFLEHADVFGHCYGTAKRFLRQAERNGHDLLLDIDVQGAEQIKRRLPEAVSIFIMPPDRNILVNDRLDESIKALTAILLAERLKRSGIQGSADDAETLAKAEGCRLSNIRERVQPIIASFATAATSGGR
jgi:guanylate kinase